MTEVAFLVGQTVTEIRDGNRVVFVPGEKLEPSLYADVNEVAVADAAGHSQPLGSLVGRKVTAASTLSNALALEFNDGSTLRCEPDPDYEAWQVVGGDPQYLVVCLPGGELAVWSSAITPEHQPYRSAVRWVRERINRLLGRYTCLHCGRQMDRSGGRCRCGCVQQGPHELHPISEEEWLRRHADLNDV